MKKQFALSLALFLLLCLLTPVCAFAEDTASLDYVTDTAGLLSQDQVNQLNSIAGQITERYNCGVYIITVKDYKDYNPSSVAECAEGIYSYYHLGVGEEKSGVLLLLSMAERDYDIDAYGYGNYAFTDYGKEVLAEEFLDNFRRDDWNGGFTDYLTGCNRLLAAAGRGEPVDVPGLNERMPTPVKLLIVILLPCLVALIVCSSMKAKMKTAKPQVSAEQYLSPNGVNLLIREDRFINRTRHVEVIQESSSRSGGGGTTIGASGHSHHSGKF